MFLRMGTFSLVKQQSIGVKLVIVVPFRSERFGAPNVFVASERAHMSILPKFLVKQIHTSYRFRKEYVH